METKPLAPVDPGLFVLGACLGSDVPDLPWGAFRFLFVFWDNHSMPTRVFYVLGKTNTEKTLFGIDMS